MNIHRKIQIAAISVFANAAAALALLSPTAAVANSCGYKLLLCEYYDPYCQFLPLAEQACIENMDPGFNPIRARVPLMRLSFKQRVLAANSSEFAVKLHFVGCTVALEKS